MSKSLSVCGFVSWENSSYCYYFKHLSLFSLLVSIGNILNSLDLLEYQSKCFKNLHLIMSLSFLKLQRFYIALGINTKFFIMYQAWSAQFTHLLLKFLLFFPLFSVFWPEAFPLNLFLALLSSHNTPFW